ncbi:MAG: sugar porter family MFS transporter [Verrucomicrobia bacterium]|nr:sugar porter family MFS transporter [Verrucomicrobiota bacterium]
MHFSAPSDHGSRAYVTLVCCIAALGGLLFGYDTAVINGAIGFLETHFALTAAMKGWAASSALLGCVLGVSLAGPFSDRLGRKKTLVLAGALFLVSSVGTALPRTLAELVAFRMVAGVGVGIASMASPLYIAEIAPAAVRGRMVSVNQFAIISGMLVIYFVNYAIARAGDPAWRVSQAWRWMFASGIVPALLFLGLLLLAPESPRWLIQQGRRDQARRVLERVGGARFAAAESEAILVTLARESGLLRRLFEPGLRRPLAIGVALAVLQQVTGINVFLYFGAEIFKQLGTQVDLALLQQIAVGSVNLLFTVVAMGAVDRLGRRPLMMVGAAGMGVCLVAMGCTAQCGEVAGWMVAFVLGYIACFALSVGPVTWVILSEIFPTRIRGRALSLATFWLWTANFIVSQTFPMMEAPESWLVHLFHHGFPFYLYGVFCGVLVVVVWRWVPETKGKSLEQIEQLWGIGVGPQ